MVLLRDSGVRNAVRMSLVGAFVILTGATACSRNAPPGTESTEPVVGAGASVVLPAAESDQNASTAARFGVPPGHLPPAGQCRVWMPGEPPGQQKQKYPVGQCSSLRGSIPAGGWLIYSPTDNKKEIRVWEFGPDRELVTERIYSAVTGELLRQVAPGG
ncbi:MAG: hypothetical protein OEM96_09140 [Gemmatimonadota bacterium]|nr:hypothetical protein [Gemmatimonadota bacterium]